MENVNGLLGKISRQYHNVMFVNGKGLSDHDFMEVKHAKNGYTMPQIPDTFFDLYLEEDIIRENEKMRKISYQDLKKD